MKKLLTAVAAVAVMAQAGVGLSTEAVAFDGHGKGMHFEAAKLDKILAAQPDSTKARYEFRHPKETLEFLGVAPGMTVVDALPGGYYGNILVPYLGDKGGLYGVQYSVKHRGVDWKDRDDKDTRIANHKAWPDRFAKNVGEWTGDSSIKTGGFLFGDVPSELEGKVDAFLLFRAMHHLNKHEDTAGTRTAAIADIYKALKPGGIVGIVQHRAPEDADNDWAKGFNGYVKQSVIVDAMKAGGFELVATSEVNANPKDKPVEGDFVWRLPPVLAGSRDDAEKRAKMQAIGESDRMTLKFRKPS